MMKRNKIIIVLVIMFCYMGLHKAYGQQEVMFTQYMFNGIALNPAYAGSHESVSMTFLARNQWGGIEGAPNTQTFSMHSPLNKKRIAVGLSIIHDKITIFNQYGVNGVYAYRIPMQDGVLSMGLQAGFTSYNADLTKLDPQDQNDTYYASDVKKFMPNFGAGIYYYSKQYYLGLSIPQLIQNKLNPEMASLDSDARQIRHYFLSGGYVFDLSRNVKLKPNALLKVVEGAPMQIDLNASILLSEVLWLGLSWRSFADFDALIELQITDQLKFGYAYDFATTTDIRRVNSGSHEVLLNYRLKYSRRNIITPRYF